MPDDSPRNADLPSEWRLSIDNRMEAVAEANRLLEEYLAAHGTHVETVFAATLALEEVVTNVIKYAYCDDLAHVIVAEASFLESELRLRFRDDGRAYNPLLANRPAIDPACEDLPVGGLGVHLIKEFAHRVEYERAGGENVLTVVFRCAADS